MTSANGYYLDHLTIRQAQACLLKASNSTVGFVDTAALTEPYQEVPLPWTFSSLLE